MTDWRVPSTFSVLGPRRVADGGRDLDGLRPSHRRLLAILLLEHGRAVPTDQLIDRLWAGEPPATAKAALHAHVSVVRRAPPEQVVVAGGFAGADGLAATGEVDSHTGMAGPRRRRGRLAGPQARPPADHVIASDFVTADGRLVRAGEREHPELFWALRGGGNVDTVTNFEFQLHELGTDVTVAQVFPRTEDAPEALRFYRDLMTDALPSSPSTSTRCRERSPWSPSSRWGATGRVPADATAWPHREARPATSSTSTRSVASLGRHGAAHRLDPEHQGRRVAPQSGRIDDFCRHLLG